MKNDIKASHVIRMFIWKGLIKKIYIKAVDKIEKG